jgi:hypothetical protein
MRATQVKSSPHKNRHRPLYAGDPFFSFSKNKLGRPDKQGDDGI